VERLVVSLDAPYADLHDSMRGHPGAFDLSLTMLRRARRLPFAEVAVNQLLTAGNAHSVADMLRLCRDEEIDRLALLSFRDVSENGLMADLVPDLSTLQDCWRGVAEFMLEASYPRFIDLVAPSFLHPEARTFLRMLPRALRGRLSFHHTHLRGVTAFRESIVIKPHGQLTGDTAMSNFDEFDMGSARLGVSHVWGNMAPAWRERLTAREARLRAQEPCSDCPRWNVCRGGCPAAALHQWGEVERHDRTCDRFRAAGHF
jgi:radical SAM protein with 4Fe4S-binding SPASM domain